MKQILSIALLLCSFVFSYSQSSAPIRPAAKLNVSVATGSDPYTLTVSVLDDLSRFSFADFGVGDSVYLIDGSDLLIYVVTSKLTSPNRLVVDDVNNTGISAPTGQGAIVKSTANYKLPFYISGLRDDLRSMMMNRFSQLLDGTIYTAGNEIYRYLGSTGVAPAVTAAVAGATTAQNTVGEIYTWDPSTNLSSGAWSLSTGGGGGGLTPNSVDSTHIKQGGIAASDLSQHAIDTLKEITKTKVGKDSLPELYVKDFGILPSNSASVNSANFKKLLNDTIPARGGGHIVFGNGIYEFSTGWKPPYYLIGGDATLPQNYNLVISGMGGTNSGRYQDAQTGTIVRFDWARGSGADTLAFIDTRGAGRLELYGITFRASTAGRTFVHTTNTTLDIHSCAFIGSTGQAGVTTDASNDAIELGHYTSSFSSDTTYQSSFQGYGSTINSNFFNSINTVLRFGTFANGNFFTNNNIWNQCGGQHAIYAYSAAAAQSITGNVISDNLFESHYTHVMYLESQFNNNQIIGNGFFDSDVGTKLLYLNGCQGNYIQHSFYNGLQGVLADNPTTLANNTFFATEQSDTARFNYQRFQMNNLEIKANGILRLKETSGNSWFPLVGSGVFNIVGDFGSGNETKMAIQRLSAGTTVIDFPSSTLSTFNNSAGALRFQRNTNEFWFSNDKFYSLGNGILYGTQTGNTTYKMTSTGQIGWSGTTAASGGEDVGLSRLSAGVLGVVNGGGGIAPRDFVVRKLGVNNAAPTYQIDVDANTGLAGDPARFLGLKAGSTSDSLVSSNAGVLKRLSIQQVTQTTALPQGSLTVGASPTTTIVVPITNSVTPLSNTDITHIQLWYQAGGVGAKTLLVPTVDFTLSSISGSNVTMVVGSTPTTGDKFYILIK